MTRLCDRPTSLRQLARGAGLSFLVVFSLFAESWAVPPLERIPTPYYSFDLESPKVPGIVPADAILTLEFMAEDPHIVVSGAQLGLGDPDDDLDAVSIGTPNLGPDDSFVFLLSVDRATMGVAPADPVLVELGVPYNVLDQAARGHAAGDEYMSTMLFTLVGGSVDTASRLTPNTALCRNNYDEGGTDSGASPPTTADEIAVRALQDNYDSASGSSPSKHGRDVTNVYFSAQEDSPSLTALAGVDNESGAHIFFNADPLQGESSVLYATYASLDLEQGDDIDAMIVFDAPPIGDTFGPGDRVLFSLAPLSPSLGAIEDAPAGGTAADVFSVEFGSPAVGFASGTEFGLGNVADNVDSLQYWPCDDAEECAIRHGIRKGAIPTVSDWGLVAMVVLLVAAGGFVFSRAKRRVAADSAK